MENLVKTPDIFTLSAAPAQEGMRLDSFLSMHLATHSRTYFQKLIQEGQVQVNGITTTKPGHHLTNTDTIQVTVPVLDLGKPKDLDPNLKIRIVFEHEHFLIIEKPAFLSVHAPHPTSQEASLIDWILANYNEIKGVGSADRPGIVHRLDKNTSGLLIIARSNYAHLKFGAMFHDRTIKKSYLALVHGHPDRVGSIDFSINRDPVQKTKMTHQAGGRTALTHYNVREYFEKHTLLEAHPVTGRTHQIRVHVAAIGYPIVGDATYGTASSEINRQALHAYKLSFIFDNQEYNFTCEPPEDFQKLKDQLKPLST
jgi:23S rRNA pseudouridine1911/1915/1917 synthase